MTGLQKEAKETDLPLTQFVPAVGDNLGLLTVEKAIAEFQPDVIYATGEPGSITAFAHVLPVRIPFLAYVPVEGEPIAYGDWRAILMSINWFTCTEYGQRIAARDLQGKRVDYVYHGVDHDIYYPDAARRDEVRQMLGWGDKFVVMTVAANVRRKQHPRLFEAIAILRDQFKQRDVILYDHTVPFNRHWLEGWHLPQVADAFGVHNEVVFNPMLTNGNSAPEVGTTDIPGLADLYRAADLFVLPSQVEGFGLPIAEAMASGLPVAVTKYAAGWEVASPAGVGIAPKDWETAKNGTRYANLDPMDIAKTILDLKRDPRKRARMSAAGIERAKDYDWSAFKEYVVDAVEKAREAGGQPEGEPGVQAVA